MRPKEIIENWVQFFNATDLEGLVSLYHKDAINHQVVAEPCIGRQAIAEMFKREFAHADMTCLVENIFEDGDWAILEWKDPLGLRGCGFFQIENEVIIFQRGYFDQLSFLRQQNLPLPTK